jgi:hypothetical protein
MPLLTRELIASDAYLTHFDSLPREIRWSRERIEKSLMETMRARSLSSDVWIFGYGSLIWNPLLNFDRRQGASLHGWHRSFCLRMIAGRGSAQAPGRMLALEPGGATSGVAFRLAEPTIEAELRLVWADKCRPASIIRPGRRSPWPMARWRWQLPSLPIPPIRCTKRMSASRPWRPSLPLHRARLAAMRIMSSGCDQRWQQMALPTPMSTDWPTKWRACHQSCYAVLLGGAVLMGKIVPGGFVPAQDKDYLVSIAQLPSGASLDRTEQVVREMGEIALQQPGVERVTQFPGLSVNGLTNSSTSRVPRSACSHHRR